MFWLGGQGSLGGLEEDGLQAVMWVLVGFGALGLALYGRSPLSSLLQLLIAKAVLDIVLKEIHGWLLELPKIILMRTCRRIPFERQKVLFGEKSPDDELQTIIAHTYEKRPITGLIQGLLFAFRFRAKARKNLPISVSLSLRVRVRLVVGCAQVYVVVVTFLLVVFLATLPRDGVAVAVADSKIWGAGCGIA
jgi:hypothetical protein